MTTPYAYQKIVRLTAAGQIDAAKALLLELADNDETTLKDLHDAIIRDTGRAIL